MKIIFARHGETVFGRHDRFEGLSDSPLTDKGRKQAKRLAEFCKKEGAAKIYSSPLGRARATSLEIAKLCNLKVVLLHKLKEMCYGEWEKKSKIKLQKLKIWVDRQKNLFEFVNPGEYKKHKGESYAALFNRLLPFFQKLTKEKKNIVIVSHRGVVRCAKKYFEKINVREFNSLAIPNNYVFIVEIRRNKISRLEKKL